MRLRRRLPDALRAVAHDDELSVVQHLDELRTRIIICLLAVSVAFGIAFWQNQRLLRLINRPLASQTQAQVRAGQGPLGATYQVQQSARDLALQLRTLTRVVAAREPAGPGAAALAAAQRGLNRDITRLSALPGGDRPVTLGIGEPFTTTLTVALIFALILSLPVLLHQAWAYLVPAVSAEQRRRLLPLTAAIPLLFVAGVAFGYFVILPAAVRFFQNFNADQFNVLVQAGPYLKFAATTMLAMGLLFEVPVAVLAVTQAGIVSARQLRGQRRYAIAASALVAAALPGDAVTMLLETVPLYLLWEISLVVAAMAERRASSRQRRPAAEAA